jgi:hypothetical protein
LLGSFVLVLQLNQASGLLSDGGMTECLQGFVELRSAHCHIDAGLFQRLVIDGDALRTCAFHCRLPDQARGFRGCRSPLRSCESFAVSTLLFVAKSSVAGLEAMSRLIALSAAILLLLRSESEPADDWSNDSGQRQQVNAVHRTGCYTQIAASALINDDGVHELRRADDGVDRAGLNALGAANAFSFTNKRDLCWRRAALLIDAQGRDAKQLCQGCNGLIATRGAFIDCLALGDSFGIGHAAGMPAFSALGLGEQGVDALDEIHGFAE